MKLNANKSIPKATPKATPKPAAKKPEPKTTTVQANTYVPNKAGAPEAKANRIVDNTQIITGDPEIEAVLNDGEKLEGIRVSEKYNIKTLDVLNVVLQERYAAQPKEGEEDQPPRYLWKIVAYCASIESALRTIVDREINLTINQGLPEVVKKVEDLKKLIKKIEY